jgi:antitoxin (DNA-binding transcriptional repressor) of toxin-antitoxin stability system
MRFNPSVTEVARHFADYINRVAFRGEHFILMRGKRAVAELRPVPAGKRLDELPTLLASLPRLSLDDAALLATDLDEERSALSGEPLRDAWVS